MGGPACGALEPAKCRYRREFRCQRVRSLLLTEDTPAVEPVWHPPSAARLKQADLPRPPTWVPVPQRSRVVSVQQDANLPRRPLPLPRTGCGLDSPRSHARTAANFLLIRNLLSSLVEDVADVRGFEVASDDVGLA